VSTIPRQIKLPEPIVERHQDGSITIEFLMKDRRLILILEENEEDSSWHYVSKGSEGVCTFGSGIMGLRKILQHLMLTDLQEKP
jgi:hypothetical protein